MAEAPKVAVIRTGLANLASVLAGLRRAGAEPFVTENPADVQRTAYVVLPGVGAFGPAMEKLNGTGMANVLRERFEAGSPTLSVCLGLQLLHEASDENPGVAGLGIIPLSIRKFPDTVRIPQLGWNEVRPESSAAYLQNGFAYFANSYHAPAAAEGWTPAHTIYGVPFVSAIERGAWLACQFHPELSGDWGLQLLKNWLSLAPSRVIASELKQC
ncbi:MAG TPA: imidazole glycerol phosphate synthase subunit HisH [Candidatus Sumerlaeota bacterium]|nr:imidazole glycerol phosphate synthase subunit HisH [Candidatus Sumerlaeota bacterium]